MRRSDCEEEALCEASGSGSVLTQSISSTSRPSSGRHDLLCFLDSGVGGKPIVYKSWWGRVAVSDGPLCTFERVEVW